MTALRQVDEQERLEWQMRTDLAAVFRLTFRFDWNRGIGNHYSLMLPGRKDEFLVNPRGMLFCEVTASNLIVANFAGKVVRGQGEIREVAYHIHAPIHRANPNAQACLHVHPPNITALSLLEDGRFALSHHNNLIFNDRVAYDDAMTGPACDLAEGDRIAKALGDKTILVMANHGVTVVGPTVADAFSELAVAENTCGDQLRAMWTGLKLRQQPDHLRWRHRGAWSERVDARMSLDAWRRILDKEEPDYPS